MKPKAVQVN